MHNNLIILAGGMSSRMKKPTTSDKVSAEDENEANIKNKSLISVGHEGRPLMDYLLYNAKNAGYKSIYIVINEKGDLFKEFYGKNSTDNNFKGLNISYAIQHIPKNRTKPFGTADAVFQALEQFPYLQTQQFTVCNSDNLYSEKVLRKLRETAHLNAFISYNRDALEFSLEKILSFAIVNLDVKNYLKNIIEKPSAETAHNYRDEFDNIRVSMNIFKLDGNLLYSYLKNCPIHSTRKEKELPTAILNMIKTNSKAVLGIPISEHVPDLTSKEDIVILKEYLKEQYPNNLNW